MRVAILLLNFGEPEQPTPEVVVPFLERIFAANASLERETDPETVRARSRALAERRAPGLIETYRTIGGSPLAGQARAQALALERELAGRGLSGQVLIGMQFTEPSIPTAVAEARELGPDALVVLPVYPLCGPSTTVAALEEVAREVRRRDWGVELLEISGWHRHPAYVALRVAAIRRFAAAEGADLTSRRLRLLFSAHGTPLAYLDGSRYALYVQEWCARIAGELDVTDFLIGYQNHSNRGIPWTEPEIGSVLRAVADEGVERVIVDAVSFMHEQSETLADLDIELRGVAADAGLGFHRVPVPHDAPEFAMVLADLVEAVLRPERGSAIRLRPCACRVSAETRCLNAEPTA